jgi:sulfite exporter TauE/SafE/plastocyanin domain-containing protein
MCGGINLSQTLGGGSSPGTGPRDFRVLLPSLFYNTGRVVSYTFIGAIVGALGSVLTVSGRFQGIIQLAAGVFMVIMGINMLGVFPGLRRLNLRLPKIFAKKIDEQKTANRSPLLIGLLNGLMPCGPLQAIQLYALSTGSAAMGALSMFLFSVGTVPFMFILGAASSMLSKKFSLRVMSIGAVLVTVMGLIMLSNGWNLGGFPSPADTLAAIIKPAQVSASTNGRGAMGSEITGGVQVVNSTLGSNRYPAITVQQGIPVKWTINAPQGSINGCNNRMIIREYGIEYRFKTGENVIEFTPEETGRFSYSCWMGMIRSSITVVAAGESAAVAEAEPLVKLIPAGVVIPTDAIAFSTFNEEQKYQEVTINLRDDGFTPSLVVVQRDIPTIWVINNDSLEPGNSELIFPAYYTTILMQNGDNPIQLLPDADFDFSTADNVYYGYVKVVDDINDVDTATIKSEVSDWETLIYPIEYFEAANQGMSCCN